MEHLIEYGVFAAKFLTVVGVLVAAIGALIVFAFAHSHVGGDEHVEVKSLNDKFRSMAFALQSAVLSEKALKAEIKKEKQAHKQRDHDRDKNPRRRIFVCRFDGDLKASAVASLREEISTILAVANDDDEVVALIESPGGTVHGYGLAASQLARITEREIKLTAAVDKVAASGGYMMASVANHIIAAPFAIIGSIGVVAQLPNFNRLLKQHNIDFEEITAGEYKRTLTMFGENTDVDRAKFREELEDAHALFKEFVQQNRPSVDIDRIATGEHWFGKRALDLNLVDELMTSDDYLFKASQTADVYQISYVRKKAVMERLMGSGAEMVERVLVGISRLARG